MRKFGSGFLKAFEAYSSDKFCPPQFNTWCALSIVAGALERRTWLPWSETYSFYPNIYVLMVSNPGTGKSVSLERAVELLRDANRKTSQLNIMPNQVTEAKFIELMQHGRSFTHRFLAEDGAPKEVIIFQNAGYFFASEGSATLKDVYGEFLACLTAFYDCPREFSRATKKDGKPIMLKNVCMNILAACTFDYLGKLVNDENIQGGFASRLLYVQHKEKMVRDQEFQSGYTPLDIKLRDEYRAALVHDLSEISKMTGAFSATPEFASAWKKWWPESEERRQNMKSQKLQSILARTNTNVLKVSMLLSAAEADDRVLRIQHWEQAMGLVEALNADIPGIFQEAKAAQGPNGGPGTLTNQILLETKRQTNPTRETVSAEVVMRGYRKHEVAAAMEAMFTAKLLGNGPAVAGAGITIVITGDAHAHL